MRAIGDKWHRLLWAKDPSCYPVSSIRELKDTQHPDPLPVIWPYAQWYTDMSAVSGYGGWAAGRTSGLYKIEPWDAGSWCHYHSLSLASVKSRLVFPLWYWLIRVVTHKGPLNGCVCIRYKETLNSFVYCWWSGNWLLIPLVKILSLYLVSNFWKFKCFDCV